MANLNVTNIIRPEVEGQSTPTLRWEYWIPVPDESRLPEVTISAPTMPDPQLFTQLFDSFVDSITWGVALEPVEIES